VNQTANPTAEKLARQRDEVTANPLLACPESVRMEVWRLWACHQHLFPTPLPVAGALGVWINDHGLHPDDAGKMLRIALSPGRMESFKFPSDLLTYLATAARELTERRRRDEEISQRRNEMQTPSGDIREAIRGLADSMKP
jgi:hypothetical protein